MPIHAYTDSQTMPNLLKALLNTITKCLDRLSTHGRGKTEKNGTIYMNHEHINLLKTFSSCRKRRYGKGIQLYG